MPNANTTASRFDSKAFLGQVTQRPGVYQMYDQRGDILYVGKAKNLKARLTSYFRSTGLAVKTEALVQRIAAIEVTVTGSETEALLLEQNLIKSQRPPYNILLRDDKSYPYIFVSSTHDYPALTFHRGARRKKGRYFGPFPSGGAVRESLSLLQKVFRIRQCEDSFFSNRGRPCLQYQIERCSAPCVGLIPTERYAEDVRHAEMFLEGKNQSIADELATQMEAAAGRLDFEAAAQLRDQIISLQKVQEEQRISGDGGDADILAGAIKAGSACVHQLFVKGGRVVGSKAHYPKLGIETDAAELLGLFVGQYYLGDDSHPVPPEIITSHGLVDQEVLVAALEAQRGTRVRLSSQVRGQRNAWLQLAKNNADHQINSAIASRKSIERRYVELQQALSLEQLPTRLECFDISHSSGEATVASCVVFDGQGPKKSDYRRFNIDSITPGDDYAAMHSALLRRYTRLKKGGAPLPDLLVIDGGKGQVAQAEAVLEELQIAAVRVLGVAKGPTRKAGMERLIFDGMELDLAPENGALHLLQQIRDEAHRFAITGHRARRGKARGRSRLEDIPGVGSKRRQALLKHFGGLAEVERAGVEEIAKVSTISRSMAEQIYAFLHQD